MSDAKTKHIGYGDMWALLDCRQCRHYQPRQLEAHCGSAVICTNGDQFAPTPPVWLWRTSGE